MPRTWHLCAFIVSYVFWNCLKISYRSRKYSSKLSNIVSYLIIGWWNYWLSYRLLKALSAINDIRCLKLLDVFKYFRPITASTFDENIHILTPYLVVYIGFVLYNFIWPKEDIFIRCSGRIDNYFKNDSADMCAGNLLLTWIPHPRSRVCAH